MNAPGDDTTISTPETLASWQAAWPQALATWSRYTRLHDPMLCASSVAAAEHGLQGSFAMIRLLDQSVVVDLQQTRRLGLDAYAVEILAHEVGHHVLAPATAADQYRLLARMRRALPTLERHAPMVANLFTDLLINDRLQRQSGLRMADIYRVLHQERLRDEARSHTRDSASEPPPSAAPTATGPTPPTSSLWTLYMGIYEQLWALDKGSLGGPVDDEALRADAWLGARLIRAYAGDWMTAAGRFASLLLPHLVNDLGDDPTIRYLQDTLGAAEGCEPEGLLEIEDDEVDGNVHPAHDRRVTGVDSPQDRTTESAKGQTREPFEYGEILRAAGLVLSDHDLAVRWYRERALPHLVRFPVRPGVEAPEPQVEGLEPWDLGDALDEVDWLQSIVQSPHVVPGVTTVRRVYGRVPGAAPDPQPVDLDLYVDSSGSMPNPQVQTSYLALAGAVIALSALRVGSRVQVTLWSGKRQVMHTPGFVRDEDAILRVLTAFFGGATCFPIHRLRETYDGRDARARAVHILMISDDGITTMFDDDERGHSGWDVGARALAAARAGGTMALNLPPGDEQAMPALRRAQAEQGWRVHAIQRMEDLVAFAHAFSRAHYGGGARQAASAAERKP